MDTRLGSSAALMCTDTLSEKTVVCERRVSYSGKISQKKISRFFSKPSISWFKFRDFQPPKHLFGRQTT